MTKAIRVLFASLLFGTALLAGAQDALRVQVPFEFHVNGTTLAAGDYTVRRVFERDNILLKISDAQGKASVSFLANLTEAANPAAGLSFHRYGDSYFLSGVTTESGKFSLQRSKQERLLAMKGSGDDVAVGSK